MEFRQLTHNGALHSGSDVWFLPTPEDSPWARKIDWYLNFQIAKAQNRTPRRLSDSIKNLIKDQELEFTDIARSKDSPLMVSSAQFIETKSTVCIPYTDKEEWIQKIFENTKRLKSRKIRIFLPLEFTVQEFESLWPDKSLDIECTLVAENMRRQ